MTNTKNAIELAVKNGWKKPLSFDGWSSDAAIPIAMMDVDFWRCLGKALPKKCWACEGTKYFLPDVFHPEPNSRGCGNCNMTGFQERDWRALWHSFIDTLISGGSPESFFTSLFEK